MKDIRKKTMMKNRSQSKRLIMYLMFSYFFGIFLTSYGNEKSRYTIIQSRLSYNEEFAISGVTELSKNEIVTLESLIKECILNYNNEIKNNSNLKESEYKYYLIEDFDTYFRQYVPLINEFGEKIIWVNAFCSIPNDWEWQTQILGVHDGGNCYFNLSINLTQKTCHEIGVNGYA